MKKLLIKSVLVLSVFSLSACGFLPIGKKDSSSSAPHSQTTSNSSVTSNTINGKEVSFIGFEDETTLKVGDIYDNSHNIYANVNFKDGTRETIHESQFNSLSFDLVIDKDYLKVKTNEPFAYKMDLIVTISGKIDNYSFKSKDVLYTVHSLTEYSTPASNIELVTNPSIKQGDKLIDHLDATLKITYSGGIEETYNFKYSEDIKDSSPFSVKLYENKVSPVANITNYVMGPGNDYVIEYKYLTKSCTYQFNINETFYRLAKEDLTILNRDISSAYAPANGDVKMLVIPISITGDHTTAWTSKSLNAINDYYFGSGDLSLKSYYERASLEQMEVSGMVTNAYTETVIVEDDIMPSKNFSKMREMIAKAVDWVKDTYTSIDFDDYDLNDDGCFDNVHLITNFDTKKYEKGTGTNPWSYPLWPHMSSTGDTSGTNESPSLNVYSLSAIDHVNSAITAIHEQGHIFGLDDYYDYAYSGVDYIGQADMQSHNVFDWNSYSKLTVGWVSPYVVEDSCEITIGAASLTGDCVIVPADAKTFNNSAFDEYFLIELFSPYGNNSFDDFWTSYKLDPFYGIRMYHVDSRLFKYTSGGFVPIEEKISNMYQVINNNCYEYTDDPLYVPYQDFKLLTVIQKGGEDTFGQVEADYYNPVNRHNLTWNDLFQTGDTFTFSKYAHFLSKQHLTPTTMDNGETFPYKIEFTEVTKDSATIKFIKQ